MNFTEDINEMTWPEDDVEQEISDFAIAERLLEKKLPELLVAIKRGNEELLDSVGAGVTEMPDLAYRVSVIGLARMALRHGSLADNSLAYHNERHLVDVLDHLRMIIHYQNQQPAKTNPQASLHHIGPVSCLCLSLFAATHDIRQSQKAVDDDGIGHSERASADEALRILKQAGLRPQQYSGIFQLLRWMIYGSTFFVQTKKFNSGVVEPGALAPLVGENILRQGVVMDPFSARHSAELVSLATDIDTANVAEPINQYARQSVNICQEVHQGRDFASTDQQLSRSILNFLTNGQQQYFFHQQRFYSVMAQKALNAPKQQTGELLKQLITWMQQHFLGTTADSDSEINSLLPNGQVIMQAFLDKAERLAGESTRSFIEQPVFAGRSDD